MAVCVILCRGLVAGSWHPPSLVNIYFSTQDTKFFNEDYMKYRIYIIYYLFIGFDITVVINY